MPRKALVSKDDAVAVIEQFFDHFQEGRYPVWSSNIWKQMSRALGDKWSANNVYTHITQNRRGVMTTVCENMQVPFNSFESKNDRSSLDQSLLIKPKLHNEDDSDYEYEKETAGLDYFEVRITTDEWGKMKEPDVVYNDERNYPILHRNVWTDILALAIDRQIELPCAFIFDKSKIYETPGSSHYMRITGSCKSKQCGNKLFCYLNEEPGNHDFNIVVRTRDTFYDKHEKVERPLRGLRRQQVGKEVFSEGCANWRKRQIATHTKFGGRLPSTIPELNILRQAKKEYVDGELGIKPSDGKDLLKTIEEMKISAAFHGFIHEIRRDKFYVAFSTPSQLHAYKQYCKTVKQSSSISIDGTGSLVKPLIRDDGSPSGHIFLYSVTINFNETTLSVYDMLTESQDTDVIWWWLKRWQKLGAPKPKQAVCDCSRALMNGISLAFNYQTVKTYNETCFLYASENSEHAHRPPIYTYLRLDVAHLMIMIRKWKCFEHMRHTVVRQFYQYCIGLMIDCQTLGQFNEIFQLTCIVGVNEFQDSIVAESGYSVLNARKKLEAYIANRKFDINFDDTSNRDKATIEERNEDETQATSRIQQWINGLRKRAEDIEVTGSEPNSFYFVDFIDRFMALVYEFPLWTAVAIPHTANHASSAFVEGHFNIIKQGTLKNFSGLLRVDKFLKIIFKDYSGGAAIITSKLKVFNQMEDINLSRKSTIFLHQAAKDISPKLEIRLTTKTDNKTFEFLSLEHENRKKRQRVQQREQTSDNNNEENQQRFQQREPITDKKNNNKENQQRVQQREPTINNNDRQKQQDVRTAKGKYFKPNSNIQHRNSLASNIQKQWLLKNGNYITNPALIDGAYYFASNTCGFDSIMQILSGSVMDDPDYMTYVQKSENTTLRLVLSFVKNGPCAATYRERIIHLKRQFPFKISAHYQKCRQLSSYSIDMFENLNTIWTNCFQSEPSAHYTFHCTNCLVYDSPIPSLMVNHKIIGELGFAGLWESLKFYRKQYLSCANKNCTQLCEVEITYNTQIFIELDIRPNIEHITGLTCLLRHFPEYLNLNDCQYRLSGVVARLPGHYIAYCKRIDNRWEMCNDLGSKIINCGPDTTIEPHGVIYIARVNKDQENGKKMAEHLSSSKVLTPLSPHRENVVALLDDSDTISRDNWRNKEAPNNFGFDLLLDESQYNFL